MEAVNLNDSTGKDPSFYESWSHKIKSKNTNADRSGEPHADNITTFGDLATGSVRREKQDVLAARILERDVDKGQREKRWIRRRLRHFLDECIKAADELQEVFDTTDFALRINAYDNLKDLIDEVYLKATFREDNFKRVIAALNIGIVNIQVEKLTLEVIAAIRKILLITKNNEPLDRTHIKDCMSFMVKAGVSPLSSFE